MSELQSSMQTMKPLEGVHHTMCLPLHSAAVGGSAFAESLSSASPDSMRSLSSLSGGWTDSPLDVDMPEGITGRKVTMTDDSGIQSPDCRPENDNDNSVSIYLDADEEGWCEICDDQDNVTLVLKQGQNNNHSDVHSHHERRSSDDSSATEAALCCSGYEEDDDEEEDSFLSLSSVDVVMRCQNEAEEGQKYNSSMRPSVGPVSELHKEALQETVENGHLWTSTKRTDVEHESELHQETLKESSMEFLTEENMMQSSIRNPWCGMSSEIHQEALQESMKLPNKDQLMKSSSDVGPVIELLQDSIQSSTKSSNVAPDSKSNQQSFQEPMEPDSEFWESQNSSRRSDVESVNEVPNISPLLHSEEVQMQSSPRKADIGPASELQESMELCNKETNTHSSSKRPSVSPVSELHQDALQEFVEIDPAHLPEDVTLNDTELPPGSAVSQPLMSCQEHKNTALLPTVQNTRSHVSHSHTRHITKPPMSKTTKTEMKRFPRPDLKNIKSKVNSRAASAPRSASTTPTKPDPNQSAAGVQKKPPLTRGRTASRKEIDDVFKKNRSSASQARAPTSDPTCKATIEGKVTRSVSGANQSSDVQEQSDSAEVMDVVDEEKELHKEEVIPEELSAEGTPKVKNLNIPGCSGSKGKFSKSACVPAGVRAATPAGVPRTCGPASSCKAPQKHALSKLPIKGAGLPTSLSSSSLGSTASESNTANRGAAQVMKSEEKMIRPSSSSQAKPVKTTSSIRSRANSTPAKASSTGQKTPALPTNTAAKPTQNALQRSGSAKPNRSSGAAVDKSSRVVRGVRSVPHGGGGGGGTQTEEQEEKHFHLQNERKNQCILQLRKLLNHSNRRLEALALVIQHIFNEKEEALKQKKDVALQLKSLREELTQSVSGCERVQKEKEDLCVALESAVFKLQQQHQAELTQLEGTLRDFYSTEWDKTHQVYQQEADRYRELMEQQVEEIQSKQEALRKEQEVEHTQMIEALKDEYQTSLAELRKNHENDVQELDCTRKRSETSLQEKIDHMMAENEALSARLREEEEKRKALSDKGQKDPHLVYLEQELESLKVVMEIKTSQMHQQDKKLMQMDKLMESNVKLEECLKKLQQENEDYKARMDKHAALSRQLSSEQAMLQQTLQMESKVNKRLSMENEELLWKLHNGDLSSPRRVSSSSPFNSPRNSASFPSAPILPR